MSLKFVLLTASLFILKGNAHRYDPTLEALASTFYDVVNGNRVVETILHSMIEVTKKVNQKSRSAMESVGLNLKLAKCLPKTIQKISSVGNNALYTLHTCASNISGTTKKFVQHLFKSINISEKGIPGIRELTDLQLNTLLTSLTKNAINVTEIVALSKICLNPTVNSLAANLNSILPVTAGC